MGLCRRHPYIEQFRCLTGLYTRGMALATLGRRALDLLYPPRCAVCGTNGAFVCESCLGGLPRAAGSRCDVCWSPKTVCDCSYLSFAFTRLRSAWRYEGEVRHLVRAFKFGGQSALAPSLASALVATCSAHGLTADVIVAVPLTGIGRRRRGYNQAALLTHGLSKVTGVPSVDALGRTRSIKDQARSGSAEERRRNVAGSFVVRKPEAVAGKTVLLVDDVATTGATLDACARVLLQAGAASVSALTLARED
jgi:ComF family protein